MTLEPNSQILYEECGKNYRYFLRRRDQFTLGYVFASGYLAYTYFDRYVPQDASRPIAGVLIPISVIFLSFIFFIFDVRNAQLFWACQRTGAELEPRSGLLGSYRALESCRTNQQLDSFTHSSGVLTMILAITALAVVGIIYYFAPSFRLLDPAIVIAIVVLFLILIWFQMNSFYERFRKEGLLNMQESTAVTAPPPQLPETSVVLREQLRNCVSLVCKQDQVSWAIFGVFWAANAVLLVGQLRNGAFPTSSVGLTISIVAVSLNWVWCRIQVRALAWLDYYEKILKRLEEAHRELPVNVQFTGDSSKVQGRSVRELMKQCPLVAGATWVAMAVYWILQSFGGATQ